MRFNSGWSQRLTRSHLNFRAHARPGEFASPQRSMLREIFWCWPETCTAEVSSSRTAPRLATYLRRWNLARARLARTPPSTFLFLPIHLSNSPGLATPSPDAPESLRSSCHRPESVTNHRKVRSFGGAPCRRAAARRVWAIYAAQPDIVNHVSRVFHKIVMGANAGATLVITLLPAGRLANIP